MLFNSFDFGFFLVIVYLVYWSIGIKRRKEQNLVLLISSYVFYGLWDWRFLILLFLSSLIDFTAGKKIDSTNNNFVRKLYLWGSIAWNLGVLFIFKYFNFFIDSFSSLFSLNLAENEYTFWNIIIPVGLSFYTFQTISYTVDVYRKKINPTRSFIDFFCFVSFFPQLVAGPIERAGKLLPQFKNKREFNVKESKEGLRLILWGLFKKILVADKLGIAVSLVFSNPENFGSFTLIYASVLFSFQLYCDFSGYTDIAIGTAKLFGFKLSRNFDTPYLAKSITEFWKRWHITLTQWFTDYIYIPFVKKSEKITNSIRVVGLLLTMFLVGLWHGANWTYIVFGLFNGIVLGIERIPFFRNKATLTKKLQKVPRIISFCYVFTIFVISSIFFRSQDIEQAFFILKRIFSLNLDTHISSLIGIKLIYLILLIIAEMITRSWTFPLQNIELKFPKIVRWVFYYTLIFIIIRYAEPKEAFIYFQF